MLTERALTTHPTVEKNVTTSPHPKYLGNGIVSWEMQEQKCQPSAYRIVDVVQSSQAVTPHWQMVRFP